MPTLYRKRLIPDECVNLKDDNIIFLDSDTIDYCDQLEHIPSKS